MPTAAKAELAHLSIFHADGRDPSTWTVIHCFSRHFFRELDLEAEPPGLTPALPK